MIVCKDFPNQTFETKSDLFKALVANKDELIRIKKSNIQKGIEKGALNCIDAVKYLTDANKSGLDFELKSDYIYPIISTTRYVDSHKDCHLDGCFTKTVKEQQGKVYYALDHELKWDSILAWEKDVNMFVANVPWSAVGKSYAGTTEALIFEIRKDAIRNKGVLDAIESKVSKFENSIRMQYHDIVLALDSNDDDMKEYKTNFDENINQIANKEVVLEDGFVWLVKSLGIHKEGSLVVAGGSNDATSILSEDSEPQKHSEDEPSADIQEKSIDNLVNILNNFKLK